VIEDMMVPLMIIEKLGKVNGKTRLQKLTCLACSELKKSGMQPSFSFQLYRYGPFSFDLATTLRQLVAQGFVQEDPTAILHDRRLYVYSLTNYGKGFLKDLGARQAIDRRLKESVGRVVERAGSLPLRELVEKAYDAFPTL
jgi:uncharacterized protein YwgA